MPTKDEVQEQLALLATYRRTLAVYRRQQAQMGVSAPPGVEHGIIEARQQISRIKATLRQWDVAVDDHPDDSEAPANPTSSGLLRPVVLRTINPTSASKHKSGPTRNSSVIIAVIISITAIIVALIIIMPSLRKNTVLLPVQTIGPSSISAPSMIAPFAAPAINPTSVASPTAVQPTTKPTDIPPQIRPTNIAAVSQPTNTIVETNEDWKKIIEVYAGGQCPFWQILPDYIVLDQGYGKFEDQMKVEADSQTWVERYNNRSPIIGVRNYAENKDWVVLSNKVNFTVNVKEVPEHVNILQGGTQCGGGIEFAHYHIQMNPDTPFYKYTITNPEFDAYNLAPGEVVIFVLDIDKCNGPGIYHINLNINYTLKGKPGIINWDLPYEYVCPKSYGSYKINYTFDNSGKLVDRTIEYFGEYAWDTEKQEYVQK